ncbi:right-handed parallel beta-helix repeat-containing protein [Paenibacillus sp. EC2-1]|uniref:right-handed parallel beta-helix repeat-containing protein n=1 Tax=Paenibacillus sp. EC2-1 TaxID=3388665 RepID=UPI003BEF4860
MNSFMGVGTIIDISDYGAIANSGNDASQAFRQAIAAAKQAQKPVVLNIPYGVYDFQSTSAEKLPYYITNTTPQTDTPDALRTIGLLFKDMDNITIQGNGSTLMFHGLMTPIAFDHVTDVHLHHLKIDFNRPVMSEITITATGINYLEASVHPDSWYTVNEGRLTWIGENGWSHSQISAGLAQQYDPISKRTWRSWNPVSNASSVEDLGSRTIRLNYDGSPDQGAQIGQVYQIRNTVRYEQGAFVYRSNNIRWTDVDFYAAPGLGIVSQYCENLEFLRLNFRPREGSGRTNASMADFMHFSGCKGDIQIVDSNFFGAHDDPINVHGTHLRIIEKPAANQIKVRFMHPESWGFDAFLVDDRIDFIQGSTLLPYGSATITGVSRIDETDIILTLDTEAPASIEFNHDVVENITWTAHVTITGNTFESVPTRGVLVSTRGKVRIEKNTFNKMHMSAILIADDAESWYESGMVTDVSIKNNLFIENGAPVIYIAPENKQYAGPVHRNITIEGNKFQMLDNTLLQVKDTQGLQFLNNEIIRVNPSSRPNDQHVMSLTQSQDIVIQGNTFKGEGVNLTIQLLQMSTDMITVAPEQQCYVIQKNEVMN